MLLRWLSAPDLGKSDNAVKESHEFSQSVSFVSSGFWGDLSGAGVGGGERAPLPLLVISYP